MKNVAHRRRKKHKVLKGIGIVLAIVVVFCSQAMVRYYLGHRSETFSFGTSFSVKYAKELGLEPRETLLALMDDLKIRRFRLMSYWDQIEPESGKFDFAELDWQMQQAERTGSQVSLAIGLRQPRYPECHSAAWVEKLPKAEQVSRLKDYMAAVVQRYKRSPALVSYQLENEALNTAFGLCKDFDRQRLVEEFQMVKRLDPEHPILVSVSNEFGIPFGQPRGDIVGFSIYHRVYDARVTKRYVEYPIPGWYHWLRAGIIESLIGRPVTIHELQAEPWGPEATVKLSIEEQDKSMNPERLRDRIGYAKATQIRQSDLWGGEWWYWRKVKFNDPSLWETARELIHENEQTSGN